jgi:SAM-dependent methyltransferase
LPWETWAGRRLGERTIRSLDLGCGAGAKSLTVFQSGSTSEVHGIDISEDRIAEAERMRAAHGVPGEFRVADVNTALLPPNTYDLIFSSHSLHHFLALEHVMSQVHDALTPGGLFILEEFVGPTQFQWTDRQIDVVRTLMALLPEHLRMLRWGAVKPYEGRPTVADVVAASPFESIRSAEILPLFRRHFRVLELRRLGGTIQHLLYNGIVHNFTLDRAEATSFVQAIIDVEDALIDSDMLPSDFMLLVGTKR